jgi:hypothetical protein
MQLHSALETFVLRTMLFHIENETTKLTKENSAEKHKWKRA